MARRPANFLANAERLALVVNSTWLAAPERLTHA
jgi:hypothetical protein